MARVRSYRRFAQELGSLSKEQFLARVTQPHLYFTNACDDLTALFKTVVSSKTPSGPLPAAFVVSRMQREGIVALEKDAGRNAFGLMITLGRAPNNDLVVAHERVSKFHAYFRKIGSRWTITDGRSTNGTTVDGVPLEAERVVNLRSGASIEFAGALRAMFLDPESLWDLLSYTRHAITVAS